MTIEIVKDMIINAIAQDILIVYKPRYEIPLKIPTSLTISIFSTTYGTPNQKAKKNIIKNILTSYIHI